MHLALTDRLICPRCGPEFGLVLLAHEVRERRVLEGDLGCSQCKQTYPVRGGLGDLQVLGDDPEPPPSEESRTPDTDPEPSPSEESRPPDTDPEEVLRLGALLGVTEGPGTLLVQGPAAGMGKALSALIGGVEVVGVHSSLVDADEEEGLSRLLLGPTIPFFPSSFIGVALSGEVGEDWVKEAARVVAPGSRVVVLNGGSETKEQLLSLGMSVLLEEEGTVVARREKGGNPPLVTLRGP
jgi:uncharacterized protein YbaR (Trm112 family)